MTALQVAQSKLASWLEAEDKVASGQSYQVGSRRLARADLAEIRKEIQHWQGEVDRLIAGRGRGARVIRIIPRDL